jgi:hypothetical protein
MDYLHFLDNRKFERFELNYDASFEKQFVLFDLV